MHGVNSKHGNIRSNPFSFELHFQGSLCILDGNSRRTACGIGVEETRRAGKVCPAGSIRKWEAFGLAESKETKRTAAKTAAGTKKTASGQKSGERTANRASKKTASKKSGASGSTSSKSRAGRAAQTAQDTSFLQSEAAILCTFAVCVFLFLSNFHIGGAVGEWLSHVMLGVFGSIGYVAPLLLFAGMLFYASNRGNIRAVYKMLAVEMLLISLCGLAQLIFGGGYREGQTLMDVYMAAGDSGVGGGVIGGVLVLLLHGAVGTIGAYLALLVLAIISLVCITEKSFVSFVKRGSGKAYEYAREDYGRRKELWEERREEKRVLREEKRAQSVDFEAIDLSRADLVKRIAAQEAAERARAQEAEASNGAADGAKESSGADQMPGAGASPLADVKKGGMTQTGDHRVESPAFSDAASVPASSAQSPADVFKGKITIGGAPMEEETVPFDEDIAAVPSRMDEDVFVSRGSRALDHTGLFGRPVQTDGSLSGGKPADEYEKNGAYIETENIFREMGPGVIPEAASKGAAGGSGWGAKADSAHAWDDKLKETEQSPDTSDAKFSGWDPERAVVPKLHVGEDRKPESPAFTDAADTVDFGTKSSPENGGFLDEDYLDEDFEEIGPGSPAGGESRIPDLGKPDFLDTEPYVENEEYWEPVAAGRNLSLAGDGQITKHDSDTTSQIPGARGREAGLPEPDGNVRGQASWMQKTEPDSQGSGGLETAPEAHGVMAGSRESNSDTLSQMPRTQETEDSFQEPVQNALEPAAAGMKKSPEPSNSYAAEKRGAIVTASGKVIETNTEDLTRQRVLERAKERQQEAAARDAAGEAVKQEIKKTEQKPKKPYVFPPLDLLKRPGPAAGGQTEQDFKETAIKLQQTLRNFGVGVTVTNISCGPTVTRYELHPEQGVKVSRILALSDDIKLNLAAADIRIEAPIPGKAAIGIEVPNKVNSIVYLRELLETSEFKNHPSRLAFAVGKDIGGQTIVADLAKMPHLLIAGQTGSGKSVGVNTLIMGLVYRSSPEDVKLILVDPKVVELSVYNGIPHLLIPVVTDPKKAAGALNWAVAEMMDRYNKFAAANVRDLKGYNARVQTLQGQGDLPPEKIPTKLPQIVIIIDELADLMMVASNEVEEAICRLAQLARAAGIHLVIATQRPSVNVITGVIKANVPSRIAFSTSSGTDSRTILDMVGAEKLLGNGDMLFYPSGYPKPLRVQGAFVSDSEVMAVTEFLKEQNQDAGYDPEVEKKVSMPQAAGSAGGGNERDALFVDAGKFIIEKDKASIGILQRMFKIGFNRAARIMDQLAEAGVVGEEEGTKPRKILMSMEEFEEFLEMGG